ELPASSPMIHVPTIRTCAVPASTCSMPWYVTSRVPHGDRVSWAFTVSWPAESAGKRYVGPLAWSTAIPADGIALSVPTAVMNRIGMGVRLSTYWRTADASTMLSVGSAHSKSEPEPPHAARTRHPRRTTPGRPEGAVGRRVARRVFIVHQSATFSRPCREPPVRAGQLRPADPVGLAY